MKRSKLTINIARVISTFVVVALFIAVAPTILAGSMSSTNYQIERDSLNSGGEYSTSTNYTEEDTLGEIGTGDSLSTSYDLRAGFRKPAPEKFLEFSITGLQDTDCASVTDGAGNEVSTTSTTVSFGEMVTETFYNGCLRLTVNTNSSDGYRTTIEKTQLLTSGSLDTIPDGSCDGSPACTTSVSEPWDTSSNNGFAYCLKDSTGDAGETADTTEWTTDQQCGGASQAFKLVPTSSSVADVMGSTTELTEGDVLDVGLRLSVAGDQAAGPYSTTIIYITTPTF